MKVRKYNLKLSVLSLAMVSAFTSMYAYADDEEAAALKNPTSSVTVEEIYVSQGSQKFGEYNGLNKQGGYINGNLNIRGGAGYKKNEEGDTTRWSIQGTDLGLSDRSASAGYSDQGNWGATIGYDQLQHNLAPGYQTPYQGNVGGNGFNLPKGFGTSPNTDNLSGAQKNTFNQPYISTTRENTSFNAVKVIDKELSFNLDFNHLSQTGAKLMAFAASGINGATAQTVSILPNPTNYQTDTLTMGANWQGEKARISGSYFGSFFRDAYNQVQWQTFAGNNTTQTMSTAPSNQLQQLNLGGGYDFSSKTKLVGGLSYSRNTQTATSGYDSLMVVGAPAPAPAAFNGLVNSAHADFKLTDQSIQDLALSAGYKFDSRANSSQSSIQQLYGVNRTTSSGSPTFYPNTPLSYTKSVFEVAGDYRLTKDQKVRLAYVNQNLNRYCSQYGTGYKSATNYYPAGADCVTANATRSNNIDASYKVRANDSVDLKVAYAVDIRQTTWNQNAITTMEGASKVLPTTTYPTGTNAVDFPGFRPYFEASRNLQTAKANLNWQLNEDLGFNAGAKWLYAAYPNSLYGVKNSTGIALNLDTIYNYAENGILTAYVVQQNGQRNMTNASSYTASWNNTLNENDVTAGLGIKHTGLMAGKLTLTGDVTYSLGQTQYNTTLNPSNTTACLAATSGTCGDPGVIRNAMTSLKFGTSYEIDKHSKFGLRYIYQHLTSNDYYYNGLQMGTTPTTVMPTNQTSGSYNVNVIAASYTYSFD